jgi:hypothetical protein
MIAAVGIRNRISFTGMPLGICNLASMLQAIRPTLMLPMVLHPNTTNRHLLSAWVLGFSVVEDIASTSGRRNGASTMIAANAHAGSSEVKATIAGSIQRRRLPICHHRPSVQRHLQSLKEHRRRPPLMPETRIRDLHHLNFFTNHFPSASEP